MTLQLRKWCISAVLYNSACLLMNTVTFTCLQATPQCDGMSSQFWLHFTKRVYVFQSATRCCLLVMLRKCAGSEWSFHRWSFCPLVVGSAIVWLLWLQDCLLFIVYVCVYVCARVWMAHTKYNEDLLHHLRRHHLSIRSLQPFSHNKALLCCLSVSM